MTTSQHSKLKYIIKTYGCQFNYSDSERTATVLENAGYKPTKRESEADLIVFNTCSIKQKAEDRVYGLMPLMRELKKTNKKLLVAITGCMVRKSSTRPSRSSANTLMRQKGASIQKSVEKDPLIEALPEVDLVFRIEDLAILPNLLLEANPKLPLNLREEGDGSTLQNYFKINPKSVSKFQSFVPIARGCDKFCAYCVVPYTRGRERSRPAKEILAECEMLVSKGCKEITLLGQNVDSYGLSFLDRKEKRFKPLKPGEKIYFTRLLEEVDKLKSKGLKRVRWTSPHPKDMTDDVIDAVARLETQMPYIHLPVQAGSNAMLKKMNRPYTVERYLELIKKIRKKIPDCAISTDIIVGFCGETEEMFNETVELFKKVRWDMIYFSPYSMRKFTAAHRTMKDDVPSAEKSRRWHVINNLLNEISLEKHKKFEGKNVNVLVERYLKGGLCEGYSEHYKRTQFPVKSAAEGKKLIGQIVPVKVKKGLKWNLRGEQCIIKL